MILDKGRFTQWMIVVLLVGFIIHAGENAWLVMHRDLFILSLMFISFVAVSLFVFINRKNS
ncbi:hypothetical protein WQ57_00490 [Mesobacillus campisalis]|uniref:Uncharacterized protein n=1 Tax=Mesobacillus campisalis TaxID=1408103 RepID=A0A0M2T3G1_9BACI|nr:hypothetical protein [Mesobacillus campisalis]KKK39812.1 hypothetical protein WQ57_00490 [Mesobacillus campisalis]